MEYLIAYTRNINLNIKKNEILKLKNSLLELEKKISNN